MTVITPSEKPFRKLSLRVLRDEDVIAEGILDDAQLANVVDATEEATDGERKDKAQVLRTLFVFSPFQLDGPCVLRVRAETEEEELRGLGLRIALVPAEA